MRPRSKRTTRGGRATLALVLIFAAGWRALSHAAVVRVTTHFVQRTLNAAQLVQRAPCRLMSAAVALQFSPAPGINCFGSRTDCSAFAAARRASCACTSDPKTCTGGVVLGATFVCDVGGGCGKDSSPCLRATGGGAPQPRVPTTTLSGPSLCLARQIGLAATPWQPA